MFDHAFWNEPHDLIEGSWLRKTVSQPVWCLVWCLFLSGTGAHGRDSAMRSLCFFSQRLAGASGFESPLSASLATYSAVTVAWLLDNLVSRAASSIVEIGLDK